MKSFYYALRGLAGVIKSERNMRIHLCFCFYVVLAGVVVEISLEQWGLVILSMAIVTACECINTAVEMHCDALCSKKSKVVRFAKDAAAGGVLLSATAAASVGGLIFFRMEKVLMALQFFEEQTMWSVIILLTLIPLGIFALGGRRKKK